MTRTMYDSINASQIPRDADLVAGYVDGRYAWSEADWELFPNATRVRIAVFPTTNDGHVLDCENGDAETAQCPAWVLTRRAAGVDPTIYCSYTMWPSARAAFSTAGVAQPHWWIAGYPTPVDADGNPVIPPGAIAHQWVDRGPYDESIVADYWPGVDTTFNPEEDNDMAPKAVIFLAASATGAKPLYPYGVLRDEFGVYLGLQSDDERANLQVALNATECWVKEGSLTELVRISRVGVDSPRPVIVDLPPVAPVPVPAPVN